MLYTDNYSLKKPQYGEIADVADINYNADKIDGIMWDNRRISVAMYDTSETYDTAETSKTSGNPFLAGHEDANGHIHVYKCLVDNTTGTWAGANWEQTDLASEIEEVWANAGTEVEANPSGTATDTLEKLRVDSTIYAIPEDVVSKEAEGNPITFADGADAPLVECEVEFEAQQDLHGYDKPWVGGAGKNKLIPKLSDASDGGIALEILSNGKYRVHGTNTKSTRVSFELSNYSSDRCILPVGNYTISWVGSTKIQLEVSGANYNGVAYTSLTPTITSRQISVVNANQPFNYVTISIAAGETVDDTIGVQIEQGSVATSYTPYSNICPISGYSDIEVIGRGFNIFDEEFEQGGYNSTTGAKETSGASTYRNKNIIPVSPNRAYYFYCDTPIEQGDSVSVMVCEYDISGNYIGCFYKYNYNFSFTTSAKTRYINFRNYNGTRYTSVSDVGNTCINLSDASKNGTYEPYNPNSKDYIINLGSERFGGTLDVVRGVLRVDSAIAEYDGSSDEDWRKGSYDAEFYIENNAVIRANNYLNIIRCDKLQTYTVASTASGINYGITGYGSVTTYVGMNWLYVLVTSCSNVAELKTFLSQNPITVCYKLANPFEVSLTPTAIRSLLGNNTIYTDGKTLSIEYITSKYSPITEVVSRQISTVEKLLELIITANREEEMKATQNYTAGDLLIVSGKLYKASSNIANGSTLVINSNVTSTTIAAELAALA